ncbi:serine/threonine phosphatase [Spirochaetia bacterium]|nr:serine/threonine phosphatase [Spirochaetia bacterium]
MRKMTPEQKETFVEVDHYQVSKYNQSAPGDVFYSQKIVKTGRIITTLSDGLGSGIKAGVLATLTSTMITKFISSNIPARKSAEIIMNTLPVSKEMGISYATFTVVDIGADSNISIVEYDNPPYIYLRGNKIIENEKEVIQFEREKKETGPKTPTVLSYSSFAAKPDDRIVFFSDGVTQAGLGGEKFPSGWGRENALQFIIKTLERNPSMSARNLSKTLVTQAAHHDGDKPADDISCAVVYFRKPRDLLIITGPPWKSVNDKDFAGMWTNFSGTKIISGGTTAKIISRELGLKIKDKKNDDNPHYPPEAEMEGAAMVTEGIVTLADTAKILENNYRTNVKNKTAHRMAEIILNCDRIFFAIGTRINDANYDPAIPVELGARRTVARRIANILEAKYLKAVSIRFF